MYTLCDNVYNVVYTIALIKVCFRVVVVFAVIAGVQPLSNKRVVDDCAMVLVL